MHTTPTDPFRGPTLGARGELIRRIVMSLRQRPGATPRELVREYLPELAALNFETTSATNRTLIELTRLEATGMTRRTPSPKKGQPATWEWIGGDAEPPADEAPEQRPTLADLAARLNPASQVAWKKPEAEDVRQAVEGAVGDVIAQEKRPGGVLSDALAQPSDKPGDPVRQEALAAVTLGFHPVRGEIHIRPPLGADFRDDDDLGDAFDEDDDTDIAHLRNDVAMLGDHLATLSERVGQLLEQPAATPDPEHDGITLRVRLPGLRLDLNAETGALDVREMRLMHNVLAALSDAHGEDLL